MKKTYETPNLYEIRFQVEEKLMASLTLPDESVDGDSVELPEINIFG